MEQEYYREYARLENTHWWFTARLNILRNVVRESLRRKPTEQVSILNTGVATGNTTRMLEQFGQVTSVEYDAECCDYLRTQAHIDVVQASLTELPFGDNSFDVVCAFDVIEHIENDQQAINEINRVLKPGGTAVVTVPAYNLLWSKHDEVNHHYRRYNISHLKNILRNKLTIRYISYFNCFLFLPISLARIVGRAMGRKKTHERPPESDFKNYQWLRFLGRLLYSVFNFERNLVGKVRMPFGVSLIVISSKQLNHEIRPGS